MDNTFSDGLMMMTMRGSLVKPVRLSPKSKLSLISQIDDDLSRTSLLDENEADDFIAAMYWLKSRVKRNRLPVRFSKKIARTLCFWLSDHEFDIDDDARQWVLNIINKRYSIFELTRT